MKTLIVGGRGLISTAITRFMLERGDDVTLYNRGVTRLDIPGMDRIIAAWRRASAGMVDDLADLREEV